MVRRFRLVSLRSARGVHFSNDNNHWSHKDEARNRMEVNEAESLTITQRLSVWSVSALKTSLG